MRIFRLIFVLALLAGCACSETLGFRDAIEMAVNRSNQMSTLERARAHDNFLAAQRMYIPQMIIGSGLAKTFGFPLSIEGSAPSVLNVNATGYLVNPAQRDIVRAARTEWDATRFDAEDRRQQAILDTAVTYTQLDRFLTGLKLLRQQEEEAVKAEQITGERVRAGVEPQLELTRARLVSARVRMGMAQVQGIVDLLRNQLSQLTGAPALGLETVTESIPELPAIDQSQDMAGKAVSLHPSIKLANAHADAKFFRARSEHRQLYPAVDVVGQYGLFAKYNNYDVYFRAFQRNNGTLGVAIRFPFFNLSQRARAEAADAEAAQARRQVQDVKNKVSNETLKLQRDVAQFAAARDVARLEYELARSDVDIVQGKIQAGTASLRDEATARVAEGQKYSAYLDASYQLEQAQMQLLRSTGELEKWALAQK